MWTARGIHPAVQWGEREGEHLILTTVKGYVPLLCLVNVQNLNSLEDTIVQIRTILQRDRERNRTGKSSISSVRREPQSCSLVTCRGCQHRAPASAALLVTAPPPGDSHESHRAPYRAAADAISSIQHEWIWQSLCSWAAPKGREPGAGGGVWDRVNL